MQQVAKSNTLSTGFAMFSMFFGAGNVVFPLGIGLVALDKNFFAILGLLITAVGVPFMGLISMTLFNGDYLQFFQRVGKVPGFLLAFFILGLIGPFGATPRTVAVSYQTITLFAPGLSLPLFSAIFCAVVFVFAYKRSSIIDILGYFLTPFLLIALIIIIIKGLLTAPQTQIMTDQSSFTLFFTGLTEGYQTMDLLGALFFSSVVIDCLRKSIAVDEHHNYKKVIFMALKSSMIAASLLAFIYVGFSYVAAFHSTQLESVSGAQILGLIAVQMLGKHAGVVACTAVVLACLTTAIALASVFAEFIHKDITFNRLNYGLSLLVTMVITFFISTLNFEGIMMFLFPILQTCYPALIVLSVVNLLFKLHHFKPVKVPVLAVFVLTLIAFFL